MQTAAIISGYYCRSLERDHTSHCLFMLVNTLTNINQWNLNEKYHRIVELVCHILSVCGVYNSVWLKTNQNRVYLHKKCLSSISHPLSKKCLVHKRRFLLSLPKNKFV